MTCWKYLLLLPILYILACSKESHQSDPVTPLPFDTIHHIVDIGKISVLRNEMNWTVNGTALSYSDFPHQFSIKSIQNIYPGVVESFYLADIPFLTGKYKVEKSANSSMGNSIPQLIIGWVLDHDQVLGSITTDTTDVNNFVEVIRFDSIQHTVEGRFQVHLINYTSSTNGSIYPLPDSLRLTDGKFYLKLN